MKEDEVVVFLFPSTFAWLSGDGEKIGTNQPLKFTIKLIKLKRKKYESKQSKFIFLLLITLPFLL